MKKVTHATSLIGKVVRFEDGMQVLLVSGGVGNGSTWTFKRTDDDHEWKQMEMVDALPYVLDLMKQVLDDHEQRGM